MKKDLINITVTDPILSGKICPYCKSDTELIDSNLVYNTTYNKSGTKKMYICHPCKAWVGVHDGTDIAMGRLANFELRQLKMLAHRWFDPIAVEGLIEDIDATYVAGVSRRQKAYYWLANKMSMKPEFCHIGMFDETECRRVIEICQPIVESLDGSGDIW